MWLVIETNTENGKVISALKAGSTRESAVDLAIDFARQNGYIPDYRSEEELLELFGVHDSYEDGSTLTTIYHLEG